MLADGRLSVKPLISHRFSIDDAANAYVLISGGAPSLGVLLEYPRPAEEVREQTIRLTEAPTLPASRVSIGPPSASFVGAGNYASAVLISAFKAGGARLRTVASRGGVSGLHAGRKFGFAETTTDTESIFADRGTDCVVITTRHNSHARFVMMALSAGKSVFVEKPLCLTLPELAEIENLYENLSATGSAPAPDGWLQPQIRCRRSEGEELAGGHDRAEVVRR